MGAHGRGRGVRSFRLNLNINDDRQKGFAEAKRFLSEYFGSDFPDAQVNVWAAYGSPAECAGKMREYAAAGVQHLIVRFLSYDQKPQLRRFLAEVASLL